MTLAALLFSGTAFAQEGTVSGNVLEASSGEAIPGANVLLQDTQYGTATNADGFFTFDAPAGEYTLEVSFIGYQAQTQPVTIEAGETTEVDLELASASEELDEVVVTGVSVGTSTQKTAFAVSKVSEAQLQNVPGTDPASALRGKAAGVRIVQPSGRPGASPQVRLRGSKSIGGDQSPLVVVDGAITGGSLEDIDMQAVQSIEIIKGSAASSLYGSLGANGVIQVITKRGADEAGTTRVTVRNEFGFSSLANKVELAEHHGFETEADAANNYEEGQYRATPDGTNEAGVPRSSDDVYILDNEYNQLNDQQEEVFQGKPFMTNFVSVRSRQDNLNYLISFENLRNSGVVAELDPYTRRNIRLNVDNQVSEAFNVSASGLYSNSSGLNNNTVLGLGQGSNIFYGALLAEPDLNLAQPATDPATGEQFDFNPFIAGGNAENPLYVASQLDLSASSERFLGNAQASYSPLDWFTVDGQFSYDLDRESFTNVTPLGRRFAADPPSAGDVEEDREESRVAIANVRALFNEEFGALNSNLTLGYTYEDRSFEGINSLGSNFLTAGVPRLDNTDPSLLESESFDEEVRARNFLANLSLDYRDRYILDLVARRDGLSLFGSEVRYQTYYRVAGAYRLTEDLTIPQVDELKLRASYGTSGQRPPFEAQYETYNVTPTGVTKDVLGNAEIEPSTLSELEVGIDARFLGRFFLQANYADATAEDQFLLVPLSASAGYQSQWQNAGTLSSNTFEASIGGTAYQSDALSVDFNVNFDRTRQEITNLTRPAYTIGTDFGAAVDAFRIQEDVPFGAMYGNQFVTSVDELTLTDDGTVAGSQAVYGEALEPGDFTTNDDGYVVREGTEYTADEQAMFLYNEDGTRQVLQIGNATPDFNVGFGATLRFGGFQLYSQLDWEQGGDVYNYTRQNLYFNSRHGDLDQSGEQPNVYECVGGGTGRDCENGIATNEAGNQILVEGTQHWGTYYEGNLYNGSSPVSEFVEDASYLKVREISLSYNVGSGLIDRAGLGDLLYSARIAVSGRNLFTFTGYSGYDPEVAVDNGEFSPTNFRIDEYTYPNFRTYSASIELQF